VYRIGIEYQFESGHYLTGLPAEHKCARPHGHNYVLRVEFASETLDATGFVIDYFDARPIKDYIDVTWDHRMLNDVVDFNPTVENLVRFLYDKFKGQFPQLSAVEIRETPTTFARYDHSFTPETQDSRLGGENEI
jgi:6-pyruvoyltetrahydropterin/6-carboxytetrahydropterin synthase